MPCVAHQSGRRLIISSSSVSERIPFNLLGLLLVCFSQDDHRTEDFPIQHGTRQQPSLWRLQVARLGLQGQHL